jgi:hypothetical protein
MVKRRRKGGKSVPGGRQATHSDEDEELEESEEEIETGDTHASPGTAPAAPAVAAVGTKRTFLPFAPDVTMKPVIRVYSRRSDTGMCLPCPVRSTGLQMAWHARNEMQKMLMAEGGESYTLHTLFPTNRLPVVLTKSSRTGTSVRKQNPCSMPSCKNRTDYFCGVCSELCFQPVYCCKNTQCRERHIKTMPIAVLNDGHVRYDDDDDDDDDDNDDTITGTTAATAAAKVLCTLIK